MGNLYDKNNAPYLIVVVLATLTLLASGTLAVAPYVAFLSPIAAFNVALPVALSLSILSTLILALSCKMIKKIEVERNKFAEKEQELESVKQQLESKVQELENEITLGKEAASKEVEELNNQLNELTQEKQGLEKEVVELKAKVKGQLKHREEILSREYQELRDENTKLNERVDSLMEELCQCKSESEENKLRLKSEYEDELRLRSEYEDKLNLELECKSREASSLKTQLAMSRKKVEEVKRLKTLKSEKQHENSEDDIKELKRKLSQLNREKEKLEGEISDERQRCIHLESEVDKLCTKGKEYLSKIKELENELSSLKVNNEELVNESIRDEGDHKTDMDKFKKQAEERLKDKEISVLSVVKERVEQGLSGLEEQQYVQDTGHIQEAVDKFMQPIYEKLGISNQLDVSSEHSSEFEGTGENTSANEQFSKPKPPYISTPTRSPYTKLSDASCDSGYSSGCSTSTNS